jgi:hypothetical protein
LQGAKTRLAVLLKITHLSGMSWWSHRDSSMTGPHPFQFLSEGIRGTANIQRQTRPIGNQSIFKEPWLFMGQPCDLRIIIHPTGQARFIFLAHSEFS